MDDEAIRAACTTKAHIVGPRGGKWKSWRINQSFILSLAHAFEMRDFTIAQAQHLYETNHMTNKLRPQVDLYWIHMNVRNNLYSSVARGILLQTNSGVFRFVDLAAS